MTISWSHLLPFAAGVLALGGLGLLLWALRGDPSRGRRRCRGCWYDLSGAPAALPITCPECGWTAARERQLSATRRRWRWAFAAVAFMVVPWSILKAPAVRARGWPAVVPTTVLVAFATDFEPPTDRERADIEAGDIRGIPAHRLLGHELGIRLKSSNIAGWQIDWLAGQLVTDSSWDGDGRSEPGPLVWLGRWALRDEARGGATGTRLLKPLRDCAAPSTIVTRARWPRHTPIAVGIVPMYWHGEGGRTLVVTPQFGEQAPLIRSLEPDSLWAHRSLEWWRDDKLIAGRPVDAAAPLAFRLELAVPTKTLWKTSVAKTIEFVDTVDDIMQPVTSEAMNDRLARGLTGWWVQTMLTGVTLSIPRDIADPSISVAARVELLHGDVVIAAASMRASLSGSPMHCALFAAPDGSEVEILPDRDDSSWHIRVTADPELALHDFQATRYWSGSFIVPLSTVQRLERPID